MTGVVFCSLITLFLGVLDGINGVVSIVVEADDVPLSAVCMTDL